MLPESYLMIPDRVNMATLAIDRHVVEGRGDRVAIFNGEKTYTFAQLADLSNRFGQALRSLGVMQGDHFVVRLGTTVECLVAVLGGMKIGAVPIPTNVMLTAKEMEHILTNSDAVAAVSSPDLLGPVVAAQGRCPRLRHLIVVGEAKSGQHSYHRLLAQASGELIPADTGKDDPAFVLYTSGTTGVPKGVEHAHRWLIGTGDPVVKVLMRLTPEDVCLQPQDISFMYAFGCNFFYPFYAGASVVRYPGRFEPQQVLEYIARYRVTVFSAVPTIYRRLLAECREIKGYDLNSLRLCLSSGEPLPADTLQEWRGYFGVEIYDCLGQSESHIFLGNVPGMKIKPGSLGKPLPKIVVNILDDDGNECLPGKPGHLVVREDFPGLCLGYHKTPDRWRALIKGGWYYTQDYAYRDADGYYWYLSRSDDLIKSRGYLISPKEVEEVVVEHPAVLEAGVAGVKDPIMGQRVRAFVTLREGYTPSERLAQEIREHARQAIAAYKVPQEIDFVAELPKTLTGKVLRRELRGQPKE